MKRTAILINTARGKLVDEFALLAALKEGQLSAAGLDVHYEEPLKGGSPFAQIDNVILSPHIAGLSYEAFGSMMKMAMDNIVDYDNGLLSKIKHCKIL